MAGSFSSKKVSRAARTGGRRRRGGGGNTGYYFLLVVITVLGVGLVGMSRHDRLAGKDPGSTPPLAPSETRAGDRWYSAYGVYVCDKFAPNINNDNDPYGLATKNDGIIYVHPYEKKYAGHNATLGRFAKAVDWKLSRNSLQLPGDKTVYTKGVTKCGDKPGELVVKEWSKADDESSGKIRGGDPSTLLLNDKAAVTVAFVPVGDRNIPRPPSAGTLANAADADAATQSSAPTNPSSAVTPTAPASPVTPSPTPAAPK